MALKDAMERIRKHVEGLASDVRATKESLFGIIETSRPTPIRNIVKKRIRSLRIFKREKS